MPTNPTDNPKSYAPVLTKKDFVQRYYKGEFGNCSPTWHTLEEYLEDEDFHHSLIHIRNRIAGGPTYYNVAREEVVDYWTKLITEEGQAAYDLYLSAMCPTERTTLQGEVMGSEDSLNLFYTTVKKPMRDALKESSATVKGITALCLLQRHLCPSSLDWLHTLLERYPNHVVEFTTFDCEWGTLPGFNTVFWEVRNY